MQSLTFQAVLSSNCQLVTHVFESNFKRFGLFEATLGNKLLELNQVHPACLLAQDFIVGANCKAHLIMLSAEFQLRSLHFIKQGLNTLFDAA